MNRLRLLSVIAGMAVVLAGPAAATGAPGGKALGHTVRFDVVQFANAGPEGTAILAGGSALAEDDATGDTVTVTGTGQAKGGGDDASGGGTFVHRHSNGSLVASGVWVADSVAGWEPANGSLAGLGLTDGIGHIEDTSGGVLFLNVTLLPDAGGSLPAILGIHCVLPGSTNPSIEEGVSLEAGPFHFEQVEEGGATLFHVLG